ncbi:oxygen-independent coproporphyrinogen III oxidase [Henriciella litoralis]|uniref:oxygen-independent coproporphyrinogen III oxidase n=1 Tax=Henriciella litoralis TaxID=568102 RepID=UPI000A04DA22|nr:oxygen-independent coproporphyrinogen III oxidase [Henriciella litoralis]
MRDDWIEFAGAQVPRYTSYPTAVDFGASIGAENVDGWLADMPDGAPLSVYVHIPFCRKLCWYCGCATSVPNGYDRIAAYFDVLLHEIDLWAERAGRGRLTHLHFGGGTPNALSPSDFTRLSRHLKQAFNVDPAHEFSVELDPRIMSDAMIEAMAASGVTRASLGIQTLSPVVQAAINRIQPKSGITRSVAHLRRAGIKALNADLMYGLPLQTVSDVEDAAQYCADIGIDRISVFGYAHVPWFAKHQKAINESDLPGLAERMRQAEAAERVLLAEGYEAIGFDHYARPGDGLAIAAEAGELRRNFQGYTDDTSPYLIGIGQTSISRFPEGYAQSHKGLLDWRASVLADELPITRGIALTADDRMRAYAIERLMCDLSVDLGEVAHQFGARPGVFDDALVPLKTLEARGLCRLEGRRVTVPADAKLLIRNVAATLDARLVQTRERHAIAG